MKANKRVISLITLMLTVALMFSLCTLGVFAEGETTTAGTTTGTTGNDAAAKDLTGTIISLSILGVIVIAVALFCIIKREKVGKFFRSLKSETKKVVWLPWNQVRKSSLVVIVVVVIVAVVIGLLDFAFSQGIITLGTLFQK